MDVSSIDTFTTKFFVGITIISFFTSAVILAIDYWYMKNYGISFVAKFSMQSPWAIDDSASEKSRNASARGPPPKPKCNILPNPLSLFRGAEYQRFFWDAQKDPLSYYDMNLTSQDHQRFFTCEGDANYKEYEIMQTAWRSQSKEPRCELARSALEINPDCATAYILLAEEEAETIVEVERILKTALKSAAKNYRDSQCMQYKGRKTDGTHRRDTIVLIYIKRRLAMCARRLGKLKEAAKMFRDLSKEIPSIVGVFKIHENLIETLLEMQAYGECQAVVAKYENLPQHKSAALCYTAALLKTRLVADKFSPNTLLRRGPNSAEMAAIVAIHCALEYNPLVSNYLLELKPLILPPEHIVERGDSEAIAYVFSHLKHWKQVKGALSLFTFTWEGKLRVVHRDLCRNQPVYPKPNCIEHIDKELLPKFHKLSVYSKKGLSFLVVCIAVLCAFTSLLGYCKYEYPDQTDFLLEILLTCMAYPINWLNENVANV